MEEPQLYPEGKRKDPRVCLIWVSLFSPHYRSLSGNIQREVCSYLIPSGMLVDVTSYGLRFFSLVSLSWSTFIPLRQPINASKWSRWLFLSTGKVLVSGGGLGLDVFWASVYVLKWDGSVQKRSDMLTSRCSHGLIQWETSVYVFGGECKGLNR